MLYYFHILVRVGEKKECMSERKAFKLADLIYHECELEYEGAIQISVYSSKFRLGSNPRYQFTLHTVLPLKL